ncbi:MAG: class I SAM-dependent methyltransferase [Bacteroidia bacterium]|jgi:adenine-specific DNA-methyltransferase|nr:class I SAM-dependent methyltransferase [Bacteroidia bacterium]
MFNVTHLGQVFTPPDIVAQMLSLKKNQGRTLEPSAGNGAFANQLSGDFIAIEVDSKLIDFLPKDKTLNIDFFDFPTTEKFDTIIGNPPYVRYQDIPDTTKNKIKSSLFDKRSNLYLFFIEKCIKHLNKGGELIFITPRDFLKSTSSILLNKFIYDNGTITDLIDLGDQRIFGEYTPNCIIWRFEKDNFSRKTNITKQFIYSNGQLLFTDNEYPIKLKDIFYVKVGAVSGLDRVFENEELGDTEFVYSATCKTGKTKKMIFNKYHPYLEKFKDQLLKRKIRTFDESNWWQWGRLHHISDKPRIYVNTKTRNKEPFFIHPCKNYDGSVLALFPKDEKADLEQLKNLLNQVNWFELGFVCDGRFLFSQKSLENAILPETFKSFVSKKEINLFSEINF